MPRSGDKIQFFTNGIKYSLPERSATRKWLNRVARFHGKKIVALNYIFVTDKILHQMNKQFLNHDTLTDIITFPNNSGNSQLEGEIYISIERVRENANEFRQLLKTELARVMAHGLLHLCGFSDKSVKQQKEMRSQEEKALDLRTR